MYNKKYVNSALNLNVDDKIDIIGYKTKLEAVITHKEHFDNELW